MSEYKDFAVKAIEALGSRDNFIHVSKCTRSIRVNYKHKAEVNEELLKKVPGCAGFVNKGHQVQMIIGPGVNEAFEAFLQEAQWDVNNEPVYSEPLEKDDEPHNIRYYLSQFGNFVAPIFFPIIPALVIGGLILAVRNLLVNYFGVSMDSGTAHFMTALFEAGFSFLPVYIGYTTCQQLKLQPIMGMVLGALMIGNTYKSGAITNIFGVPIPQVNYDSSLMPVILGVIFMYYVDKLMEKIIPQVIKFFVKPLAVMIITAPVTLAFLGPIGNTLSTYVAQGVLWFNDKLGFIAQPLLCAAYPYMVMLGVDKALSPIGIQLITEVGYNPVTGPMGFISNLCVGASALAVASTIEDKAQKALISSFGVTGLCGVTEPAMYGALITRPKAFIGTAIGAVCSGLFAGIFGLRTFVQGGCPGLLTFVFFIDNNGGFHYVLIAAIAAVIAIAVSYIATRIILTKEK